METELRARAEKRAIEWLKVQESSAINPSDKHNAQCLLALLKPTNPAYDSPEGWWLRLSGEQRTYLYERYPEMGVTEDITLHDTCSSVPGSGADEHATVEPVVRWTFRFQPIWKEGLAWTWHHHHYKNEWTANSEAQDYHEKTECNVEVVPLYTSPRENAEPVGDPVLIWSEEHRAYWRPNSAGYTSRLKSAGIYSRKEAESITGHCGPEKQIELEPVTSPPQAGRDSEAMEKLREIAAAWVFWLITWPEPGEGWEEAGVIKRKECFESADRLLDRMFPADSILATEGDEKK